MTRDDRPEPERPAEGTARGLARAAASTALHTTGWSVRTSLRAARRVGRAATSPEEAVALARDTGEALGVVGDVARSVTSGMPVGAALASLGATVAALVEPRVDHRPRTVTVTGRGGVPARMSGDLVDGQVVSSRVDPPTLRERGQRLLERSRDVWGADDGHPAFERILDDLAPDEARILLLLLQHGPQPSVDVRTGGPVGAVSPHLIASGLTMVGARAGCRYVERVPSYLTNLSRLGLVWFAREPVRDPTAYQVVEAQPDVLAAVHSVRFAKVVRRSIHLTPFGADFCRVCLAEDDAAATFPDHAHPGDAAP